MLGSGEIPAKTGSFALGTRPKEVTILRNCGGGKSLAMGSATFDNDRVQLGSRPPAGMHFGCSFVEMGGTAMDAAHVE